jgi:glycerophosphoryl diester phosphodiesterase
MKIPILSPAPLRWQFSSPFRFGAPLVLALALLCSANAKSELPDFPENTLPAFNEAVRLGVQMIAVDVHQTKDGELVVIKDETLDRTTNGTGAVNQKTLEEILSLDVSAKHGAAFAGTRVPTLKEVLAAIPKTVWVECRLNGEKEIAAKAATIVKKLDRREQTILSCDREQARNAVKVEPDSLICNMQHRSSYDAYIEATIKNRYSFVLWKGSKERLSNAKAGVDRLKENNIKIIYYHSAVSPKLVGGLFAEGADFVQTSSDLKDFIEAVGSAK